MILDSSAIVAVVFQEPGYERVLAEMTVAESLGIGVPTLVEAGIVLSARLGGDGRGTLARFSSEAALQTIELTEAHFGVAVGAWLRFGRGRHPAALNFGDCLSYATARLAGQPLLCTGENFSKTDLDLG